MYVAYVGRTWKNDPHRAGYWVNSLQRPLHFAAQPKAQTSAEIGAVDGLLERRQANFCARYSNEGANYYVFLHNDGMFFLYILYIIYIYYLYTCFLLRLTLHFQRAIVSNPYFIVASLVGTCLHHLL